MNTHKISIPNLQQTHQSVKCMAQFTSGKLTWDGSRRVGGDDESDRDFSSGHLRSQMHGNLPRSYGCEPAVD